MAKLTDQLSTDMSVKPVREPPAPSTGLATLFDSIGTGIGVVQDTERRAAASARQREQDERQAKKDAYEAEGNRIPYEIVQGVNRAAMPAATEWGQDPASPAKDIFSPISEEQFKQLGNDLNQAASKVQAQKAAVSQGKLPAISFRAALNREYMALVAAHPDHVGKINEEFKKYGFQPSMALQAAEDMQSQHDAVREGAEKFQEEMYQKGVQSLDTSLLPTMSRDQVIAQGIASSQLEYRLSIAKQQADLSLTNKNIAQADKQLAESTRDDLITQTIITDAYNNSSPIFTALQELMISISKAPLGDQQAAFERLAPMYDQYAANYKAQAIAKAVAGGMTNTSALSTTLDDIIARGRSMWSGDMSVAKSNNRAFEALRLAAKVDTAKALPVFFKLQEAGMRPADIEAFSQGLQANKPLQEALMKEVSGFNVEFGQERASTHLMNIVKILKGEAAIQEFSPVKAKEMMPTLYKTNKTITQDYVNGKDVSPDSVLHSIGTMVAASRTISPQSGLDAWVVASQAVAGTNVRKALIKASKDPETKEMAVATIQGSRAASAKLLDAMRFRIGYIEDGWKISLNKDGFAQATQNKTFVGATRVGPVMGFKNQPERIKWFIEAWNTNLTNLVQLNAIDPTGVKGATPRDISLFYGANEVPDSFKSNDATPKDINKEIDKQFRALEDAFTDVPSMNTTVSADSARVMNYKAQAAGFKEVPASVKTLGDASNFALKVNKSGVDSSAMGTYQIVGSTLRKYAPQVFGPNWESHPFDAASQERIAKAIFEDHKGSAQALRNQWVSLSLEEAERVRKLPWAQAKRIIAEGESG